MLSELFGPRAPGRRRLRAQTTALVEQLTTPVPAVDDWSRFPLLRLLRAHHDLRCAALREPPPTDPDGREGGGGHLGLRAVIALTFLGDLGTIYTAVSVVANTPVGVTLLLVVALAVAALFLGHGVGRELGLRALGRRGMPTVLVAAMAVVWLAVGGLAAVVRLAAPTASAGGFGASVSSGSTAVGVLLAALLLVLYVASGLSAATLGFRTAGVEPARRRTWRSAWRARSERRRRIALARTEAWFRVLAAESALALAVSFRDPSDTDRFVEQAALVTATKESLR